MEKVRKRPTVADGLFETNARNEPLENVNNIIETEVQEDVGDIIQDEVQEERIELLDEVQ